MAVFKLTPRIIALIKAKIGSLFEGVKSRFLGHSQDKSLFIIHDKTLSLPGIYEAAAKQEGGIPEKATLSGVTQTSDNFIEALKHKTVNKLLKDIEQHLAETPQKTPETIAKVLEDAWKDVTKNLNDIIDSETQAAKNISLLTGIIRTNAAMKVEDPVVYFLCVVDKDTCKECLRLHVMPDKKTPKLWYLSELKRSWAKRWDDTPSITGQHPHCRSYLQTLLPSWGFDKNGKITYVKDGHLEIEKQRSAGK